jgi:hypothetical protein
MSARPAGALVLLGLGALALVGLPALRRDLPQGALSGVVVDERGFGVAAAEVFVFAPGDAGGTGAPGWLKRTSADSRGRFVLSTGEASSPLFARPPEGSGLVGSWRVERDGEERASFVLRPGRPLRVRVLDEGARPVPGAEVRAYETRTEPAVVAAGCTDREGNVDLLVPAPCHLVAFAPDTRFARWSLFLEPPREEARHTFELPRGRLVAGRTRDAHGPLPDLVVVAREEQGPGWCGFARTGTDGRFVLPVGPEGARWFALDPRQDHLPASAWIEPGATGTVELALERGQALEVRTSFVETCLPARVWAWSASREAWGWGADTDARGLVTLAVDDPFSLVAVPVDPALASFSLLDRTLDGRSGGARLELAFPVPER